MSAFDFYVLVVAIPLGLALVEIAQGLSTALRRRHEVRLGFYTPLLALFLILITSNVWLQLWNAQEQVEITTAALFFGLCTAVIYYVTASFIFPDRPEAGSDLDDWFLTHRRLSLGGTFVLLLLLKFYLDTNFSSWPNDGPLARQIGYVLGWSLRPGLILVVIFAKRRAVILGTFAILLALELLTLL